MTTVDSVCSPHAYAQFVRDAQLFPEADVVLGRQERVLRACITSFRTNESDLDYLIQELELARTARRLEETKGTEANGVTQEERSSGLRDTET
jgi:hypothetical protein